MADFFERNKILKTVNLDSRLVLVASFVRNGSRVADIGTDHAYIPVYLIQKGISPFAVASDLRKMPLENARKTIESYGLSDFIKTTLSDGLDEIDPDSCNDIIIAGMGGILIAEILSRTSWIYNEKYRLILQPMSHCEDVRKFLFENGFEIVREKCCTDKKHCYCVLAAEFTGKKLDYSPARVYTGVLPECAGEAETLYLKNRLSRLEKRKDALQNAQAEPDEVERLTKVVNDFKKLTEDLL